MNRRYGIGLSCIALVLVLFLSMRVIRVIDWHEGEMAATASSYEELAVTVAFPGGMREVNLWQREEGCYYCFLPSGSEDYELSLNNLSEGSALRIGDRVYDAQSSVLEGIVFEEEYELELTVDGQPLNAERLVFMKSVGLPTLFIDTESGNMEAIHGSRDIKEAAELFLVNEKGEREYAGSLDYIKCRGNTTFGYSDKKPYLIKLQQEDALLGMPEGEKWILLANVIDSTLIKNELVLQYAENYSRVPSSEGRFVDLYLNGDYAGNYYLCEKVEISEKRLNITNLEKETEKVNTAAAYEEAVSYISTDGKIRATKGLNNPADITGGYLVEHIAPEDELPENSFITDSGEYYEIVSPSPATVEQAEYICGLFNEMEAAIKQEDGRNPITGKHFSEYMDVSSWASKYVMEEVFHNPDSDKQSMYFYKDSDSVDSHIFAGPMWDYDRSMGYLAVSEFQEDDPMQVGEYGIYVQDMMQHEEVRNQVYSWFEEQMVPYVRYLLSADVYQLGKLTEASAFMNRVRWDGVEGYYKEREANLDYIISFLSTKVDYLSDVWLGEKNYCQVVFLDYNGDEYLRYAIKHGEYLQTVPTIATYVRVFNGWYDVETGRPLDIRRPVLQDMTFEADWIDLELILQNSGIEEHLQQADPELFRQAADILEQKKADMP